ncbi:hypothetical protein QE152_g9903 [Popillia japonica]|uniref:Uncharacterized protein n=1 Tax=Popillia japonica TaxID=7064 RepID=A0AAW1LWF6_POPJA
MYLQSFFSTTDSIVKLGKKMCPVRRRLRPLRRHPYPSALTRRQLLLSALPQIIRILQRLRTQLSQRENPVRHTFHNNRIATWPEKQLDAGQSLRDGSDYDI